MTGLFGGSRKKMDWGRLGTFLVGGTSGLDRRDQRAAMEQQQVAMDRLRSDVSPHDGPDGSGTGAARTPAEIQQALFQGALNGLPVGGAMQAWQSMNPEPKFYNTSRGVVQVTADGNAKNIYEIPPAAPTASPGWSINPDGSWAPVPGGPYDPDYIKKTSGIRREAITSNPMPSRASGRGIAPRGVTSSAPSQPARRPWENYR